MKSSDNSEERELRIIDTPANPEADIPLIIDLNKKKTINKDKRGQEKILLLSPCILRILTYYGTFFEACVLMNSFSKPTQLLWTTKIARKVAMNFCQRIRTWFIEPCFTGKEMKFLLNEDRYMFLNLDLTFNDHQEIELFMIFLSKIKYPNYLSMYRLDFNCYYTEMGEKEFRNVIHYCFQNQVLPKHIVSPCFDFHNPSDYIKKKEAALKRRLARSYRQHIDLTETESSSTTSRVEEIREYPRKSRKHALPSPSVITVIDEEETKTDCSQNQDSAEEQSHGSSENSGYCPPGSSMQDFLIFRKNLNSKKD
ncbi:unnamed protein product [Moneuplotes crassus]|uniref:Uncharacterized protein n=1 Tax=Euplotes crassus TaxID=5936 RepID=A0AAD2D0P3_EUPCR|nr:unnamed protein product [Moneuplotes crassus]